VVKCLDVAAENQRLLDELTEHEARAERARREKEAADKVAKEGRQNNRAAKDQEEQTAESKASNDARRRRISYLTEGTVQLPGVRQENSRLSISVEDLKKKLWEADDELQRLAAECNLARKEKDKQRRAVDITALDGTRRVSDHKPLFVECTWNKAILQPQERTLGSDPDAADREMFLSESRKTRYVVFLIRPDGFHCFEKYRNSLLAANKESQTPVEFGYEPVNADWDLAFPGKEG